MSELKPCPFCGETEIKFNDAMIFCNYVCSNCKAGVNAFNNKREAIKAWNTRADCDSKPSERSEQPVSVERLADVLYAEQFEGSLNEQSEVEQAFFKQTAETILKTFNVTERSEQESE